MTGPRASKGNSTALTILAVLGILYTLYFARSFLIPIAFAVLLAFLLSPVVRLLERIRIPPAFGAAIVVVGVVAVTTLSAFQLAGPVQEWTREAPATVAKARREIQRLLRPLQKVTETAEQVENVAGEASGGTKAAEVVVRGPSVAARVFGSTQRFVAYAIEVLVLLYFLLAAGTLFLEKVIKTLPQLADKKKAVRIARETQLSISTYLIANLGINLVEGVMVGAAMWALGMPSPLLWGVLTVFFEFVPYLGAIMMLALLSVTALATFDSLGHILMVPGAFLLANLIQANIVTTVVLGRRLALNPVALFVGLAFWFWIWGVAGAFIGIPLLSAFKICCDNIESLAPVGEFLGAREETAGSERAAAGPPEAAPG